MAPADDAPPFLIRQVRLIRGADMTKELYDVTIAGENITAILPSAPAPASDFYADILDGHGHLLMPGFIDAHSHAEAAIFNPEVQDALLLQGVTTVVTGQDGVSFAPSHAGPEGLHDAARWAGGYFAAINGAQHPHFAAGTVADLLATYGQIPIRVEYLVPHGTLRYAVMGDAEGAASGQKIETMCRLLRQGLEDGAVGMSTGLEYQPGGQADERELVALCKVLAEYGLPHVSHMRGYEDKAAGAVAELLQIARASGVATHISHYHGPGDELVGLVDAARSAGLDVTFDSYPYLRGCSILSMVALPTWLPLADQDECVRLLADPAVIDRLEREHFGELDDLWPRITMAAVPGSNQWCEGLTLLGIAERWDVTPAQAAVRLLISTRLQASCIFAQPPTNSPESMRQLLRHPAHMAGSDAIYQGGRPHPRGWGTFARYLATHVRELGDWTWGEAQHHLSGAAAARYGLEGRGELNVGAAADLVILDPVRVQDLATYEQPRAAAQGIIHVIINGHVVVKDGRRAA